MPGLSAPPQVQTYSRQTVATGKTFGSAITTFGAAVGAGQLIAVDPFTNSQVIQWPSVYDMADFRTIALPDSQPRTYSAVYDQLNQCFYIGPYVTTNGVPHKAITIYKLTLDGAITRLSNAVDTGFNFNFQIAVSQICTDGAFVYVVIAGSNGNESKLAKFSCVDGSLGGFIGIGTSGGGQISNQGDAIALLDPTTLVVLGGNGFSAAAPWYAIAPTTLGSITSLSDGSLSAANSNQIVVAGGAAWTGVSNAGTLIKVTSVPSLATFGIPNGAVGFAVATDGTTIWCGSSGLLYGFNTAGVVTQWRPDVQLPGAVNFVAAIPGALIAVDTIGNAGIFPNPSTPLQPPLLGHGGC